MNDTSMKLMYWISGIDFDLLERVHHPSRGVRRNPWRAILPIAAALLVIALVIPTAVIGHKTEIYVEENYAHYDGTVLHMLDIMLTQDENTFTELLGEEGTQKLHAAFVALRKALYPDLDIRFTELPVYPMSLYRHDTYCSIGSGTQSKPEDFYRLELIEEVDGLPVSCITWKGFAYSDKLVVAKIPGSIKELDENAFYYCTNLEKVVFEHGVEIIGPCAFAECPSLTEVVLPNSLSYLSFYLFNNCPSLTEITYMGTIEEWHAIEKYQDDTMDDPDCPWYIGSSIRVVHCTDGDIAIDSDSTK